MKTLLLAFSLFCPVLFAQTRIAPDCVITFTFTGGGQSTGNNTCGQNTTGIVDWTLAYYNFGFSALSIEVQSAPDAGGSPGTWITFAGTVTEGSNPATAITSSYVRLQGYNPWNRVALLTVTGSGTVTGRLYGCLQPGCSQALATSAMGTVTDVSFPTIPSWLTAAVANPTTTPAISVTPTAAQSSHLVIGTCGTATTFGPCALQSSDLPAATGTVTTLSAGDLAPVFTSSVANPTTAPALTFNLSNVPANAFLAGPVSGAAAAPTDRALVNADLPKVPRIIQAVTPVRPATAGTFRFNVGTGDVLIVGLGWEGGANTASSIADSLTTSWTKVVELTGNAQENVSMFVGKTTSTGAETITATFPSLAGFTGVYIWDTDGTTLTATVDTSTAARGNASLTTATAGDALFWIAQGQVSSDIFWAPPAFILAQTNNSSDSGASAFMIQPSAGLQDVTSVQTTNGVVAYACVALKHN